MGISICTSINCEHRTRFVCLGETPSPRVRCQLALLLNLLTSFNKLHRMVSRTAVEFRPITLEQRRWVRQQQRTQEPRRRLG
jgi:hypothetical protein